MRIRVLGPVEVELGGRWMAPGPPKQRAVLATLALNAGQRVSAQALIDVLWADDPPPSAVRNVQLYAWRLRTLVGSRLRARPPGYVLDLDPAECDAAQFGELVNRARLARGDAHLSTAATHLATALDLWHGPALSDLVSAGMAGQLAHRLEQERIRAVYELVDIEAEAGHGAALLPRLEDWIAAYPRDEPLRERHIRLLLGLGRAAEARAAYRAAESMLQADLGTGPGPELRALAAVARTAPPGTGRAGAGAGVGATVPVDDESPAPGAATDPPDAAPFPVCMLPPTPFTFVGRRREMSRLTDLLAPRIISVPVVAIAGPGGVGKSALAIRMAHRLAAAFPDGRLYLNLNGSDPQLEPMWPAEALRILLVALGVPAAELPADPEDAAVLYRARMSGRSFLLVLDNTAGTDQVRPLLPSAGGCTVLVTGRQPLTDLDGVAQLQLGTLPEQDASDLLARLLGRERVAAEDADGLVELIEACGGLPLALRVAGARLASRPSWSLRQFGRRLSDERHRLNELRAGDLAVRTSFAVSYRHLSVPARLVFGRCGLFPGPQFSAAPVAVLAGLDPAVVADLLEHLVDAALLQSAQPGRYHAHDLIRIYAAECAQEEDPTVRHAAFERLARWYLSVAEVADRLVMPAHGQLPPSAMGPIEPDPGLDGRTQALTWFETERPTLLAVVRLAAERGLHEIAARLPSALKGFLDLNRYTDDWIACHRIGLDSAARLADPIMQARLLNGLGSAYWRRDSYAEAIECYQRALDLVRALDDRAKEAILLGNLGAVYGDAGDHATAVTYLGQALTLHAQVEGPLDRSFTLHNLGHVHHECQRFDEALPLLEEALTLRRRQGNRNGEGVTLHCLADTLLGLDRTADAHTAARHALDIFIEVGDRYGRAAALHTVGRICIAQQRWDEAVDHLRRAVGIYRDLRSSRDEAKALAELHAVEGRLTPATG